MASSVSGQDEPNPELCLAILPARDYPLCPAAVVFIFHIINPLLTKHEVKMAGSWPRSFLCVFMDLDSISVHKHPKKNLANIQLS